MLVLFGMAFRRGALTKMADSWPPVTVVLRIRSLEVAFKRMEEGIQLQFQFMWNGTGFQETAHLALLIGRK